MEAQVTADYRARGDDELTADRGTVVKALGLPTTRWTMVEQRGNVGLVPSKILTLQPHEWYHESLTRAGTESLLKDYKRGAFVIRPCESSHVPGEFTISIRGADKVAHFKVMHDKGTYYVTKTKQFSSLNVLVAYYQRNPLQEFQLTQPAAVRSTTQHQKETVVPHGLDPSPIAAAGGWSSASASSASGGSAGEVSTKYDIFISLRYEEAEPPAVRLRDALRSKGLTVYLCNEPNSTDLGEAIAEALDHCSLVVIMGTPTYGKKTKAKFSTFQELNFIIEEEKPFFLIKMCDKFQVSTTKFRLSNSLAHYPWRPTDARGHPPADLVDQIVGHCHKVKTGKVTRSVAADRKQEPQDESDSAYGGEDKEALGSMLTQLLQVLRSATGEDDTEEESEEEDEDEDGASVVGQLRPVKVCQLPLHPHVVAPVSDGTAFSSMQGFTSGWGCDMCRTPHRSNAGRWRCVEGCDFDSCESCIDRFGRCSLTLRQEISKALPGMATVGDVVVLTPDYIKYFDAVGGPLKPGLAGIVVEDDHTDRLPLRVATFFGAKWWYARGAVRIVGQRGDVVDNARAQLGVPVVRGPDWKWGDQDGGRGKIGIIVDKKQGSATVRWTNGHTNVYRTGPVDFDLLVATID